MKRDESAAKTQILWSLIPHMHTKIKSEKTTTKLGFKRRVASDSL